MQVPENLTKLYYNIGEVAAMIGVSNSLIRYWESEFKTLKPQKTRRGDRKFTKKDIEELAKIYTLVKERGFTIEGAKKELTRMSTSDDTTTEIKDRLIKIRKELITLKNDIVKSK